MTKRRKWSRRSGTYGSRQRQNTRSPVDINVLNKKLDTIVQNSFHAEPPPVLYHYTTWKGAAGILTSRQFRHKNHAYTNDPAELTTADEIVTEVATQLKRTTNGPVSYMLDLFLKNYPHMRISQMTPVFIACFSRARDSDSQWKNYADNGKGLCLGVKVITEAISINDGLGRLLAPVDYSEDSWREKVRTGFANISTALISMASTNDTVLQGELELGLNAIFKIAAYAAVTAKQPKWSSEKEWRHVVIVHRDVSIQPCERQGHHGTIQYLPVFMRQNKRPVALAAIIIGPNQSFDLAREQLVRLLESAGYPNEFAASPDIFVSGQRQVSK